MSSTPPFNPATPAQAEPRPSDLARSIPRQQGLRLPAWLLAVVLGVVTLALYWPAVHFDYINFDDPDYVTSNPHVETGLTLGNMGWALITNHAANWHPLTWVSLMTDVSLFGKNAGGMHFTNLLLHAANVILLFFLLHCLTGARWRSAAVAAFFGWHPLHVESVAWISERKDVLSTCFGLAALLFYARYAHKSAVAKPASAGSGLKTEVRTKCYLSPAYWLAWFCLALGLMSKPMLVTLPFVMLLLDFWPMRRWRLDRLWPLLGEKIPFFALAAAASVITCLAQRHGEAMADMGSLSLNQRVENALVAYCGYLGKFFWPTDLAIFYPYPGMWPGTEVLLALAFLIAVSGLLLTQWRRYPFLLMGWLWFCGTLVPVIGLVQVGRQSMADRYTYIPSVGITIMLVWGAVELLQRWRPAVTVLSVMAALAIGVCLCATRRQLEYWRNSETLFGHALAVTKDNFIAHFCLGIALAGDGRLNEAIHQYQETIRLQPKAGPVHDSLGVVLIKQGRLDEGIREIREAIRLQPDYGLAHGNLGNALLEQGQTNAAIREYQEALIWQPDYAAARKNLANLLGQTGQTNAVINEWQEVLRQNPKDTDAYYNLGNTYLEEGRMTEAIRQFQADLRLNPADADAHYTLGKVWLDQDQPNAASNEFQAAFRLKKYDAEAHYNLGNLLAKKGQTDAAIAQFQETIRLQPVNADAHNNLGNLLARTGQTDAAISELQQSLRLKPEDADTHYNLGNIFLRAGRMDDTIGQFQEVLRLKPAYAPAHYNLGVALNKKGQTDAAIGQFEEAIRLEPDYAIAHNSLGVVLAAQGRLDDAISQFQTALRIKPDYAGAQNNLAKALALKNK